MPVVLRFFSVLPLWLLHALGAALGWLAFCASARYRQRFCAHAALAGYSFGAVRAAVAHAGRMVAELPRLWLGAPLPCRLEGGACVEQAYAAGRGIVYLTPHQGCFELSAQAAARRWSAAHGPITVLYRPARQAWLARLMATARNRPGMLAVPTTLAGVRQMLLALRRGEAVGLLPDQVPPAGQGHWAPFFGRDAYTMTLAVRLARQTGAAIVLARCERLAWGRGFVTHFEPLAAPLASPLEAAVLQINQAMEQLIRQCPGQYLWGYARYKPPRAEAASPAEPGV
ncbi:lysophospholipid acyltransferase family protein [Verminephrobacter eiseniae]|uniref:lysophospholipid acyltransferase family protein n=1 Tax=Verminephrobacter eiseniae TaxID=364317 RepID=UPI0010F135CD|nr:lysophospholipid acyltransferase family protein [Verminephrobacter eiseniae]KAB7597407.1 lysophospholipid acyltransferase family protein [Verminephrobacter sp. Larva24]MCW5232682.1 lysophospholipid acyltransferase family protein [Verminephrobacter eiseniae]MCW5295754.1 lysophospholipid acyltransferase family protein [Verminephrobacter eiseniae]MCW8184585.1 lysophospholipid acyltransferase family protein [Verminephrobacter eiseniae]MCW8223261.1 lysophospholipid acyltransferase family protein